VFTSTKNNGQTENDFHLTKKPLHFFGKWFPLFYFVNHFPCSFQKKKKKPDAASHSTFLTRLASPIILDHNDFFENRKNWKEEETEVATEAEREREEVQCRESDRDH
jgi:hypothetical protein